MYTNQNNNVEDYEAYKQRCSLKRRSNEKTSAQVLTDNKIYFESKNFDMHLIVRHNDHVVDFWPSRGIFIVRKSNVKGRGVFNLVDFLTKEKPSSLLDALFS